LRPYERPQTDGTDIYITAIAMGQIIINYNANNNANNNNNNKLEGAHESAHLRQVNFYRRPLSKNF